MKHVLCVVCVMTLVTNCHALVLHEDALPAERPGDGVIGLWGSGATCVAIDPEWVLMSAHQGGGVGTGVTIQGASYVVKEIYNSGYDVRLARLEKLDGRAAQLQDYADLSWDLNGVAGRQVVFGGYGKGRGTELATGGSVYGYTWSSSANRQFPWGTNVVDIGYSNWLYADFDAPGGPGSTTWEATLAAGDSGGGWFLRDDTTGRWEVVGISVGVTRSGESWFSPPDTVYAVRVALIADWAAEIIASAETPPDLSLTVTGGTGSGYYDEGAVVPIVAEPPEEHLFVEWAGDVESVADVSAPDTTVTMHGDYSITAVFLEMGLLEIDVALASGEEWVYQNAPATTQDRHVSRMIVDLVSEAVPGEDYVVTVEEGAPGSGALENVSLGEVSLAGGQATIEIIGGPLGSSVPNAAGESYSLWITVEGRTSGRTASGSVGIQLRRLGDTDGNGGLEAVDKMLMNSALNGVVSGGTARAVDLDGDGAVQALDRVVLNQVLNGIAVP